MKNIEIGSRVTYKRGSLTYSGEVIGGPEPLRSDSNIIIYAVRNDDGSEVGIHDKQIVEEASQ